MAGLKLNKKVAKEVKIDDNNTFKNDLSSDSENSEVTVGDIDNTFCEIDISINEDKKRDYIESSEDSDSDNNKKSKLKFISIGGVFLIVVAIGVVFVVGKKGVKDEDMLPADVVVDSVDNEDDISVDKSEEVDSSDLGDGDEAVDENVTDVSTKEDKVVYENDLLGLALKYPSQWYVEERADVLLNMVQSTNAGGNIDLLTTEVKLAGVVLDFSARDDLGTKVSLGVSPLVLSGDVQVADIKSLSDIISVGTASQVDEQIKRNVESGGGKLVNSVPSVVKDIGSYKVIQSAYQFEKNGIKMDVIQMLVPYGVNNIVLTATNKVGNNPINKEEVLIGILGSLGKIGDVELEDVKEVTVDKVVNNVNTVGEGKKDRVTE